MKITSLPSNDFLTLDHQLYSVKIVEILMTANCIIYEREIGCFNNWFLIAPSWWNNYGQRQ